MGLAHPSLNTLGSRKSKRKFASASAAAKHRELQDEWQRKQAEWASMSVTGRPSNKTKASGRIAPAVVTPVIPRSTKHIPSVDTAVTGAVTVKQNTQYTGDNVLGITVMHKSCLQPVFNKEAAIDAAKMRRG